MAFLKREGFCKSGTRLGLGRHLAGRPAQLAQTLQLSETIACEDCEPAVGRAPRAIGRSQE